MFNNAHYNGTTSLDTTKSLYGQEDAYIPSSESVESGLVIESIEDFKNAVESSTVTIDTGTVISVQKLDHAAISPNILSPEKLTSEPIVIGNIEFDQSVLKGFDEIQLADNVYSKQDVTVPFTYTIENRGGPTINKYVVS